MIGVMFLYSNTEGSKFDLDYYNTKHMPMLANALGEACLGWGVTDTHGNAYHAIGWAMVESRDAWDAAMDRHGVEIRDDVANYADARPQVVIGDVVPNPA